MLETDFNGAAVLQIKACTSCLKDTEIEKPNTRIYHICILLTYLVLAR